MSQIAVRLSEEDLRQLDSIVKEGKFRTRAEAVRAGIKVLGDRARDARIASAYSSAYSRAALTDEEAQMLDAAQALAAELPR